MEKITQIIPANGWVAVYDDGEEESIDPVVCFALVETGMGDRTVVPFVAGEQKGEIHNAANEENYLRVDYLGEANIVEILRGEPD